MNWWANLGVRNQTIVAIVAALVVGGGAIVIANSTKPAPAPAPSTSTVTTAVPSDPVGSCAQIGAAKPGTTVTLSGDLACEATGVQPDVTLTGNYSGWLHLHKPVRWTIRDLTATKGGGRAVLQILGGNGWVVEDSTFSSEGGEGPYGVIDVGESSVDGNPSNWVIRRVNVTAAVKNALYEPNQNVGIYVIGQRGQAMNGVIEDSRITATGSGPALKLGGTGKTALASDSTDNVVVRRNTIVGEPVPTGECAIKIVSASSNLNLDANTIDCGRGGDPITLGVYGGSGTTVTNNTFVMPADRANWMAGTDTFSNFIAYPFPACPAWDLQHWAGPVLACAGNTRKAP